jgi:CPA1 family monovalent cation:H+ antiporter
VLRAAIAATAASVSVGGGARHFAIAVAVAVVVGLLVGRLGLLVRSRIRQAPVSTVVSYAIPFAASIADEELHGSGLVAAVVAGLVTGQGAIEYLSPQHRFSDRQNWRTVEVVLEGAIFLLMGLEPTTVLGDLRADGDSAWLGVGPAALALLLTVAVRAAFIAPLIGLQRGLARGGGALREPRRRDVPGTDHGGRAATRPGRLQGPGAGDDRGPTRRSGRRPGRGTFASAALTTALENLDAEQINLELRGD